MKMTRFIFTMIFILALPMILITLIVSWPFLSRDDFRELITILTEDPASNL